MTRRDTKREDDPLKTGTVFVTIGMRYPAPHTPNPMRNSTLRTGNPGHSRAHMSQVCGFCGQRMRSTRQRTKHTKDCMA
jgi:hypothetical protein